MTAKGQAVAQTKITPRPAVGLLQRQCACGQHTVAGGECESCRKRRAVGLQRAAANPASVGAVPPIVHDVLRSPGQPLDPATRALMEPRFGYDFSNVRVHSDHRSAQSAQSVNALAYTVGHNVVFNSGQYAPATRQGQRLLAHELTHVVQTAPSSGTVAAATLGRRTDPAEQEAEQTVNRLDADSAGVLQVRRTLQKPGTLRRFSTAEHEAIGNRAYLAAQPQGQSAASVEPPLAISELYSARPLASNERANTIATRSYGQMVAIADNVASFLLLEQRERERARTRVPVLSGIWDWIGDNAHYVDLAARNRQHFHPHNYLSWQQWHWTALRKMSSAYEMGQAAVGLKGELNTLFQQFDQHYQQARSAVLALDQVADSHDADTGRRTQLEQTIQTETRVLERLVAQMQTKKSAYESKKAAARALALEAVSINGFGDHFLTDAFASGHIVTPRDALLTDFATSLLGVVETGGVLNCANIPSLAWHDLDNRFGVWVNNRAGSRWLTFGDDFANSDGLPLGRSQAPTLTHAIDATAGSIRQVWQAAAGQTPTTLAPVLDQLPRPELEPGKYPNWQPDPRQAWERQLMYAAGIGPSSAAPNTRGNQIGLGGGIPVVSPLLSAGMGCVNAIQFFAYDRFVTPMIGRVRAQYWQRYYDARQGQVESSDATPTTQDSVGGHVILGSVIGGLALGAGGAALGYLAGGPIGAVIGGVVGLAAGFLAGGLIGGLTGKKRAERPAV